jgi:histidyl-tRNA synthetase
MSSNRPTLVEPRTLKGFQDFLPARARQRNEVIAKLCPLVERYGFVPVETPVLEHLDTLLGTGGENTNKELFRFLSPEEDPIAMRFDLTVPFARLLAQYPEELKSPFRRYAVGPVFRADKPGPGRYRQFTQFDFDHAGSNDVAVDAEICAVMSEAMTAIGAPSQRLHINSRKIVDAALAGCGVTELDRQRHVLRVIDKLDKVGLDAVRAELGPGRMDESGDKISGVGLEPTAIAAIESFLAVTASTRRAVLDALANSTPASKQLDEALGEMRDMADCLDVLGVSEEHGVFDPSLARGLDYYTGPVFEMKLPTAPQFGTVMGGGRYDGLVSRFSHQAISATGGSIGLDRLLAALESLSETPLPRTLVQVLIVTFRGVERRKYLELATELRRAGIVAEVFFGKKKASITDQLSHANSLGIPVAIIAGSDEFDKGELAIKDLGEGAAAREGIDSRDAYREAGKVGQRTISRTDLISSVRELLDR